MKKLDTSDVALLRGTFCLLAGGAIPAELYGDAPVPSCGEFTARCYGAFDVAITFGVPGYKNCMVSAELQVFVPQPDGTKDVFVSYSAGYMGRSAASPPMAIGISPGKGGDLEKNFTPERREQCLGLCEIVKGFMDRARGSLSRGIPYPIPAGY